MWQFNLYATGELLTNTKLQGVIWMRIKFTCVHYRVLGERDSSSLCQEGSHSHSLGLELLVEGVKFVSSHCVGDSELRHLQICKYILLLLSSRIICILRYLC